MRTVLVLLTARYTGIELVLLLLRSTRALHAHVNKHAGGWRFFFFFSSR